MAGPTTAKNTARFFLAVYAIRCEKVPKSFDVLESLLFARIKLVDLSES